MYKYKYKSKYTYIYIYMYVTFESESSDPKVTACRPTEWGSHYKGDRQIIYGNLIKCCPVCCKV